MPQLDTGFGGELSEVYSLEVLGAELSELSVVQPYLLISLQVHAMQQVDLLLPYVETELPPGCLSTRLYLGLELHTQERRDMAWYKSMQYPQMGRIREHPPRPAAS